MATCYKCGAMFFVGGVKVGNRKFCSPKCAEDAKPILLAETMPREEVSGLANDFFAGACPRCGKIGKGVDIRRDHRLISAWFVQHRSRREYICCRSCGSREQLKMLAQTFALGWWSPRGLFLTPVWLGMNLFELAKTSRRKPSKEIGTLLAREAASELIARMPVISPYPRDRDTSY